MERTYGSLQIRPASQVNRDAGVLEDMVITTDPKVTDMIMSLIHHSSESPLTITANTENVRKMKMIMSEYPLQIRNKESWYDMLMKLEASKDAEILLPEPVSTTPSPDRFCGRLLPFQKHGLGFLLKMHGTALIADEMGLGKTVQTLAFVAQKPSCLPAVIVSPLVTIENWKREITRFLRLGPEDSKYRRPAIHIIRSGKEMCLPDADFYLINYELVHKRLDDIMDIRPITIVFDEIQNLRNTNTNKIAACTELARCNSVVHRIGLSGTPIYNRGEEMFRIAEIIKPGIFNTLEEFRATFYEEDVNKMMRLKKNSVAEFMQGKIMIRRKKKDVIKDLPDKSILQQDIPIDVNMYEEKIAQMYARIEKTKMRIESYDTYEEKRHGLIELNKQLLEMRVEERQLAGLAKAPHIVEYMTNLLEDYENEKFVIFCHHRAVHKIIHDGLWRFNPVHIIGGQQDHTRQKSIDSFHNDKDTRVIVCGLRAGSLGINLTNSAYVVFAELDWSPAIHRQAEDRLHRIGQKNNVFVHYLVGLSTFDEHIINILTSKSGEIDDIMGDIHEEVNNQKALELLEVRFGDVAKVSNSISAGQI